MLICARLILAGLRIGANYAVNEMTWVEEKNLFLYRKAPGDTFKERVMTDNWFERT